jgi:hypothetical protein
MNENFSTLLASIIDPVADFSKPDSETVDAIIGYALI